MSKLGKTLVPLSLFSNTYRLSLLLSAKMPVTICRETSKEKRIEVWAWYKSGKSYSEIGRLENLTKSTVSKIIQRAKAITSEDKFSNKKRTGRPPKLTPKGERRLLRAASNDTCTNLACLRILSKSGKKLS